MVIKRKNLCQERVHDCSKCGLLEDRDVAAATVMINWARGLERASSNVDGSGSTVKACKHTGSMQQLAQAKRQKRLVNDLSGETPGSACDRE